jgi:NAD(P)-dependent dehydrogenase (short-subunit alcohol dehydrogenase family)
VYYRLPVTVSVRHAPLTWRRSAVLIRILVYWQLDHEAIEVELHIMSGIDLTDGVAVVTGAARGIGEGIARAAARRGMKLVLADVAEKALRAVAQDLESQGAEVLDVPTDVTDPAALDRLVHAAFQRFGSIRLLINNAGIETLGYTWELSVEQWQRTMAINVLGPILCTRAFAARMVAEQKPAAIVNVAAIAAVAMAPVQTAYFLSKHAVLSFTECLALEMAREAPMIQVSVVLPGPVNTSIFVHAPGGATPEIAAHRTAMNHMLARHGMSAANAGETIVDQIAAGKFWITTHPQMLADSTQARAHYLATLARPSLPEGLLEYMPSH